MKIKRFIHNYFNLINNIIYKNKKGGEGGEGDEAIEGSEAIEGEGENGKGGSNMGLYILLGITSLISIYCIMTHSKSNALLDGIHYAKITRKLNKGVLIPSKYNEGYEYTLDFWLYLDNMTYKYNEEKIILYWKQNIKIMIDKVKPNLVVEIYTLRGKTEKLYYSELPLQRWLYITVIVKNKYLDILVNGKLYQTKLLVNVPMYELTSLHICPNGGYSGYINKVHFYPKAIDVKKIKETLEFGPTNATLLDIFTPTTTTKCEQK